MSSNECPFAIGQRFQLKKNFSYLNHVFIEKEVVVFTDHSYDPHHGITRYWFRRSETNEIVAWHVWDGEQTASQIWMNFFVALPDDCSSEH